MDLTCDSPLYESGNAVPSSVSDRLDNYPTISDDDVSLCEQFGILTITDQDELPSVEATLYQHAVDESLKASDSPAGNSAANISTIIDSGNVKLVF